MKLSRLFLQWTQGVPLITDSNIVWVSKSGNDASGDGTVVLPVLTLTKAATLVNAVRNKIVMLAGDYAEPAAVVWPLFTGVQLIGIGTVTISAATGTTVISVAPGAQANTFELTLENLYIDHGESGQDGITLDNTGMGKKLNMYVKDVAGDCDDGDMLATVHGDASNAIRIYWVGDKGENIEGPINFTGGNDGDRVHMSNVELNNGFTSSITDVVAEFIFKNCVIPKAFGIKAGHATQTALLLHCYTLDAGSYLAAAASDVETQTETVVD